MDKNHQIWRSIYIGTCTSFKCNKSVEFGEKLAVVCLIELSGTARSVTNSVFLLAIVAMPIGHVHLTLSMLNIMYACVLCFMPMTGYTYE